MERRFRRALGQSSEFRAIVALSIMLTLRAYRRLQRKWHALPNILEVLEIIRARFNVWFTYYTYKDVHWL